MEALLYEEQNSFTLEKNSTYYGNEQMVLVVNEDWKGACKRETDFDISCLLRSPDITMPTSELEQFFSRGTDSSPKVTTAEVLPGDYNASQVTEEQELFVRGFTDALQKLYHEEKQSCMPLDTNSNVASFSKSHEENSRYTFINYRFDSSEKLPPFSEAFSKSRQCHSDSNLATDPPKTCFAFREESRINDNETEILNWDSCSPDITTYDQRENCFKQVALGSEEERNKGMRLMLRIPEGLSYDHLSPKKLSSFSFNQEKEVFEEDPISLSFENAKLRLDSVQVDVESKPETEIKGSHGISGDQTQVYELETGCSTEVTLPRTENILESLSGFYDSTSDYSLSSPSTSEYSNNELQNLLDESELDEDSRDKLEDFRSGELFHLDPDFQESFSGRISPLHDEIPTNKHWLSVHTKLYSMGAYSHQNEMTHNVLESISGHPNGTSQSVDCTIQEFAKTQRKRRKNRLAAWKCRQKKLIRESCLETKVEELCYENAKLLEELEILKKKRRALEESFVQHASSGCQEAQEQYHNHAFNPISI